MAARRSLVWSLGVAWCPSVADVVEELARGFRRFLRVLGGFIGNAAEWLRPGAVRSPNVGDGGSDCERVVVAGRALWKAGDFGERQSW